MPDPRESLFFASLLLLAGISAGPAEALSLRVGPSAGQSGSFCDFASLGDAIAFLPAGDETHTIRVETVATDDPADAIGVFDRSVHIVADLAAGSGCSADAGPDERLLLEIDGQFLGGARTVTVGLGGELVLERVTVASNRFTGGVEVSGGSLKMIDSRVTANRTQDGRSGGGILVEGGTLELIDTEVDFNQAAGTGGGVFCAFGRGSRARVVLRDGTFFHGNVANSGGAIYLFDRCDLEMHGQVVMSGNSAAVNGGAIALEPRAIDQDNHSTLILSGENVLRNNEAETDGGALFWPEGNRLEMDIAADTSLRFLNNRAGRDGGAIRILGPGADLRFSNADFDSNRADGFGGAVAVDDRNVSFQATCRSVALDDTPLEPTDSYCAGFAGNSFQDHFGQTRTGKFGAQLFAREASVLVDRYRFGFTHVHEADAPAGADGLAIFASSGDLLLQNVLVENHSTDLGDAVDVIDLAGDDSDLLLFNSTLAGNDGVPVHVRGDASLQSVGSIVAENTRGITVSGNLIETCSNLQIGDAPAPVDPGFVFDFDRGGFRLASASPMIDGGLGCDPALLPDFYESPVLDLDGARRTLGSQDPRAFDLGAFELFNENLEFVFIDGFE